MITATSSNLGYLFHHSPSHFGDGQLDVYLREKPTLAHFDPEKVHVIVGAPRSVQTLDIHHPWRLGSRYQVCPGHIKISDRVQKRINVFTFGGQVQITAVSTSPRQTVPDQTLCQFTSPAPFLELTDGNPVTLMLADEIDILLAEQRARLNPRTTADFDSKLLPIDPLELYICCLNLLQNKFARIANIYDSTWQHFKRNLKLEIGRLQRENSWPASTFTLTELITAS